MASPKVAVAAGGFRPLHYAYSASPNCEEVLASGFKQKLVDSATALGPAFEGRNWQPQPSKWATALIDEDVKREYERCRVDTAAGKSPRAVSTMPHSPVLTPVAGSSLAAFSIRSEHK